MKPSSNILSQLLFTLKSIPDEPVNQTAGKSVCNVPVAAGHNTSEFGVGEPGGGPWPRVSISLLKITFVSYKFFPPGLNPPRDSPFALLRFHEDAFQPTT